MTMPERSLAASTAEPSRFTSSSLPSSGLSPSVRADHDRMANAIRALAMDAVEKAKSGHPGLPMGAADIATVLFTRFLKFDPADPAWPDRDRFVLSAGHGSMLLYALFVSARLRGDDHRRDQALPPARLAHPRTSGARPHARRRNHHRAARPGSGQCGRHGDRGAAPRRGVRQRTRRSQHLRALLRRRSDGRHQPGGHRARRAPQAQQADRPLRRQRHFHRRADVAVRQRRSGEALRVRPAGRRR